MICIYIYVYLYIYLCNMMFFGGSMIIWHFTSLVDWDQPDEVITSGNPTWFLDNSPFIDHFPIEMPISDGFSS